MEKGFWLVLATACISGFSIFLSKFGVSGMAPALFTTGKNVVVAVALIATLLAMKEWPAIRELSSKQWLQLALIGLVGGSIPFLLFFTGLSMTEAAQAGFLHKTLFVWVAILAALTLKERIGRKMVVGGLLLLAGNFILLRITGWTFGTGDGLILLATLLWAGEITLAKRFLSVSELPGRIVALGRMGFGSLFLLAYLAVRGELALYASFTGAQFLWIGLTAALLYGYVLTFYEGLKRVPASVATAVLLLGTVITTLLNLLWTGSIGWHQVVGGLLLIAGAVTFAGIRLPAPWRARQ